MKVPRLAGMRPGRIEKHGAEPELTSTFAGNHGQGKRRAQEREHEREGELTRDVLSGAPQDGLRWSVTDVGDEDRVTRSEPPERGIPKAPTGIRLRLVGLSCNGVPVAHGCVPVGVRRDNLARGADAADGEPRVGTRSKDQ